MDWKINEMINYSKDGIVSKEIVNKKGLNVSLFCMAKGTEITEHTSTKEGIIYVVDGKGVFVLEGKEIDMAPCVLIHMEKDAAHSLKAKDNTSFILSLSGGLK